MILWSKYYSDNLIDSIKYVQRCLFGCISSRIVNIFTSLPFTSLQAIRLELRWDRQTETERKKQKVICAIQYASMCDVFGQPGGRINKRTVLFFLFFVFFRFLLGLRLRQYIPYTTNGWLNILRFICCGRSFEDHRTHIYTYRMH